MMNGKIGNDPEILSDIKNKGSYRSPFLTYLLIHDDNYLNEDLQFIRINK